MNLIQNFLSLRKKARGLWERNDANTEWIHKQVFFTKPVDRIIIHWVGPYLQRITTPRDWWENGSDGNGVQSSAHFIVRDFDVLQALPLDEVGWHSGDARNYCSIGIEVCPMNLTGEFSLDTIATLKELIAHIRVTYPGATLIERHYDGVQKKDCPRYYTPVTSLLDGGGRVANPEGGNQRWELLKQYLNEKEMS